MNKFVFAVHAVLLVLQVGVNLLFGLEETIVKQYSDLSEDFEIFADFLMQLCILQICWQCGGLIRPLDVVRLATETNVSVSNVTSQQSSVDDELLRYNPEDSYLLTTDEILRQFIVELNQSQNVLESSNYEEDLTASASSQSNMFSKTQQLERAVSESETSHF